MRFLKASSGQAVIETLLTLIPVCMVLLTLLVLLYKSAFLIWAEHHLNEALYCEQTKIIQSKNYYISQRNKTSTNNTSNIKPAKNSDDKYIKRKNHRCLTQAKKAISAFWIEQKHSVVKKVKPLEYGVMIRWNNEKTSTIKASQK